MSRREVDIGVLSPGERALASGDTLRQLRERLEEAFYRACEIRDHCDNRLRASLPKEFPFDLIESYAQAKAKAVIAARELEQLGWKPA